ncbi:MAG: sulfur carrier protein ThiS adenylyltransferase ThiF [Clostridium sp.]
MKIQFNERFIDVVESDTAFTIRDTYKKHGDIVILNGFPIKEDVDLKEGDRLSVIKRGEKITKDELKILMSSRHTPLVYENLKKATVAIAGLGGLGSNIALSLARVGIGKLIIIDFDVVEPSNLNRQNYYIEHLGMYKVEATKDIIQRVNPFIEVESHNIYLDEGNMREIFKECDVVIEAFDDAKCKACISNLILSEYPDKYLIAASGMAGYFSSNTIKTRRATSKLYLCGDEENEAKIGSGLMAPRVSIAANHMANMAIRILCGKLDV